MSIREFQRKHPEIWSEALTRGVLMERHRIARDSGWITKAETKAVIRRIYDDERRVVLRPNP